MESVTKERDRITGLKALFGALVTLGLLHALCGRFHETFFINISPSIPVGLYLKKDGSELKKGDTVVLKVSDSIRELARSVGLLEHTKLLFKRIGQVPGNNYCYEGEALKIGENSFPLKQTTRRGVELPRHVGCSKLKDSELLVVGETLDSFDSRYFGTVDFSDVVAKVEPIITF